MGHAQADLSLVRQLRGAEIGFVSYAEGWQMLSSCGARPLNLGLPADNPFLPTLCAVHQVLENYRPHLVIAREEFGVLPVAAMLGIPSVFISDWLPMAGSMAAETMAYADRCLICEAEGVFPVPPGMKTQLRFFGPVRRPAARRRSPEQVRAELGLGGSGRLFMVVPGGWFSEERAPIAEIVLPAFSLLEVPGKTLLWIAGSDRKRLEALAGSRRDVRVVERVDNIHDYLAASEVVITKGTRGTTMDAAALGTPTVAMSFRQNPIDEITVPRIRTNLHFYAKAITPAALAEVMRQLASDPRPPPIRWPDESAVVEAMNAAIAEFCD